MAASLDHHEQIRRSANQNSQQGCRDGILRAHWTASPRRRRQAGADWSLVLPLARRAPPPRSNAEPEPPVQVGHLNDINMNKKEKLDAF